MPSTLPSKMLALSALLALSACVQDPQSAGETLTGSSGMTTSGPTGDPTGSPSTGAMSASASQTGPTTPSEDTTGSSSGSTTDFGSDSTTNPITASGSTGSTSDSESESETEPGSSSSSSSSSTSGFETTTGPGEECFDQQMFPDDFSPGGECDVYDQDCPAGEKCTYADTDADEFLDATVCETIAAAPAEVGDPCDAMGDPLDGVDDCNIGAFCYIAFEDPDDGVCVAMAGGDSDSPVCDDPTTGPTLIHDTAILCLDQCDPVLEDCNDGLACQLSYGSYFCLDNYVAEQGPGGENPCANSSDCSSGYSCHEGQCYQHCDAGAAGGCGCNALCVPPPGLEEAGLCL